MHRSMQSLRTAVSLVALAAAPNALRADSDVDGLEVILDESDFSITAAEIRYTNHGKRTVLINWMTVTGTNLKNTGRFKVNVRVRPGQRVFLAIPPCLRDDPKKKSAVHVKLDMENE